MPACCGAWREKGFPANVAPVVSLAEFKSSAAPTTPLVVDCAALDVDKIEPGKVSAACGKAAYIYIEQSIRAALAKQIDGVVTGPIHKEALRLSGVNYPGHTEIFTALTGAKRSCMMLYSEKITVSMVTTHIGYHEVPGKLSVERVLNTIELTAEAMRLDVAPPATHRCVWLESACWRTRFVRPGRGREIRCARRRRGEAGVALTPLGRWRRMRPSRTGVRKAVRCDRLPVPRPGPHPVQDAGVRHGREHSRSGLPIIRTSVDHGTAFDIAWQGKAAPTSLYSAIHMTGQLAGGRAPNTTPPPTKG